MAESISVMVQGRVVYTVGDLFAGETAKIYGTQNPKLNKQGQPYKEYGFGLAVPKTAFTQVGPGEPGEIWSKMQEAAYTIFPNRVIPANFHMKYKDGDTGTNQDGTPVNTKMGYPSHVVFSMKTSIPMKFFRWENGNYIQISDGIKCGDYVSVQVSINAHAGVNAGLYLNPSAVLFLGYGEAIVNVPSATQIFGSAAPVVPQGASMTPTAPTGFIAPTGAPQTTGFAGPAQAFGAPAPQMSQQAQPHYGVLPQVHQPQGFTQAPQGAPQAPQMPMPPIPGFVQR
jgi:hypothetical protein